MKLTSKLCYQVRKKGLDITINYGIKIINSNNNKYIHILPNGKICSDDLLGHDKGLKDLLPNFLVKDPFLYSGSFICLPCRVSLHVGKDTLSEDINFAEGCVKQSFASIKNFNVIKDDNLLSNECMINHEYDLSFKERQALIKACLGYLS